MGKAAGLRASSILMWHLELEKPSSLLPALGQYYTLVMMCNSLPEIGDTMMTGCSELPFWYSY